ncbi:TauD/TfdA dioxygenase family protein [Cupriavidus oxalaticus]|jgi:taurine dioxygenase|uniref:Enzyme n=1 Tax=Cupriavidus oxalaticus TaxID=96344 RepID=A0A976BIH3_9BURK|nr:TauD/TfdA family dioxygenase [Cupriavidus oxalaticus]QRQ84831.1 TauD/TfdA family dioxygenase [Cupriavidus oxalaticus]QRQ91080.1 TauD/TfdA family dioxygenase [Cupriavidus oxalaticus]WQD85623.1 TauD/TfdA family dioxygenase [Cupriavidus oxalaticus]SPC20876.1 putative enzyme [Cupriavidus oxalaticus]
MTQATQQDQVVQLDIHPVAGRIGAEVRGVALHGDLPAQTFAAIRAALLRHKVLFFRDQVHLDDSAQQRFAALFGELVPHPTVPPRDGTQLLELDSEHGGRANSWHTDVTFDLAYPAVSVLRAVTVPASGGDTVWANTAAAYQDLPEPLRELADKLWALHTNDYDYAASRVNASSEGLKRYREVFTSALYETEHPVVRVHPESGERTLVLGHFVKKLLGYSSVDSAHLVSVLQGHVHRLENTVRWRWRAGDVAIWDNRATQHYAINDYGDAKRVVRRATVVGAVPVSVDGRHSVAVKAGVRRDGTAPANQPADHADAAAQRAA